MSKITELNTEIKRISDNTYDVTEINSAVTNIEKILNYYGIVWGGPTVTFAANQKDKTGNQYDQIKIKDRPTIVTKISEIRQLLLSTRTTWDEDAGAVFMGTDQALGTNIKKFAKKIRQFQGGKGPKRSTKRRRNKRKIANRENVDRCVIKPCLFLVKK